MKNILFIANNNIGTGLSGGDRIFIELARRWSTKININFLSSQETVNLLHHYQVPIKTITTDGIDNSFVIIHQIRRTLKAIFKILNNHKIISKFDYIYSVSDFYPDTIPALFIKLLYPKTQWIAGYYLNAPNPLSPLSPYNQSGQFFKGLIYFLGQLPIKLVINIFADIVFITSLPDKKLFSGKKTIVIRGGVDTTNSNNFFKIHQLKPLTQRKYSACFIGRLHPQKGVLKLIDIWKIVTKHLPSAKLAIIGNGQLESAVLKKIKVLKLSQNIDLLGFLDGDKKEEVFRNSCIVLHPATYDSGGMAAAEAMAWGLPGVSFDLEALETYYPQGMIKIPCYNLKTFAKTIINLLQDKHFYNQISSDSRQLILNQWDWDLQADKIYKKLRI